jgi:hypothetical protein
MRLPMACPRLFFNAGRAFAQPGAGSGRTCLINNEGVCMPRRHVRSLRHSDGSIGGNAEAICFHHPSNRYTSL